MESLQSGNPLRSVIPTSCDIAKAHDEKLIVEIDGSEYILNLPIILANQEVICQKIIYV